MKLEFEKKMQVREKDSPEPMWISLSRGSLKCSVGEMEKAQKFHGSMNSSALRCESLNLSLSWMTFRVWERRLNHPIGKSYMAHLTPWDWMTSDPKANENECVRKEKALKTEECKLGRLQELQVKGNKQWFYRFLGFTGMQQVWQLRYFGLLLSTSCVFSTFSSNITRVSWNSCPSSHKAVKQHGR